MSLQLINLGSSPNSHDGDPLRTGGSKSNDNFLELYARATLWRAGSYPDRTIVLSANRAYLLSQEAVLPFTSSDFTTELTNGIWIDVSKEAYDEALNRMRFKGTWVNASYAINDMVYSSPYIGVALTDTTDTFPPVPLTAGQWFLGDTTPTWETNTLVGDVATGWDIILNTIVELSDLRVWITPQADTEYTMSFLEKVGNDFVLIGSQEVSAGSPEGWYSLGLDDGGRLMQIGAHFRVVIVTHVATGDATTQANYVYQVADTTVAPGDISAVLGTVYANVTDDDTTDRSALLATIKTNDLISIIETGDATRNISYRATGPSVLNGTQYEIPVVLSTSGVDLRDNRAVTVDFQISGIAVNTDYVQITDAFINEPSFSGFVTQDMDELFNNNLTTDNNIYGCDVFYIQYSTSDEWYYIPVGAGGSASSSEGGDIAVIDNLTTQSATDALSANMGYVLDQKILTHLADLLNPHQTAVSNLTDYAGTPNANDRLAWDAETSKWTPKRSLSALGIFEFDYQFNTSTDATPPAGDVQRNNTDPTLATMLYFNELDVSNSDLSDYWSRVKVGDWINMHDVGDTDRRENFDVVGDSVKVGDVWEIPVNFYEQVGTPFSNNMNLKVLWNVAPEQETASFAESVTLGETVAVNDLLYLNADGTWYRTDGTNEDTMTSRLLCAVLGGSAGQTVTAYNVAAVQYTGAADMGSPVYLSTTVAGGYQTTLPTGSSFVKVIGFIAVDQLNYFPQDRYFYFFPNWDYQTGDGLKVNGVPLLKGINPDQIAFKNTTNTFSEEQTFEKTSNFKENISVQNPAGVEYGIIQDLDTASIKKYLSIKSSIDGILLDTILAIVGGQTTARLEINETSKSATLLGLTDAELEAGTADTIMNKGRTMQSKLNNEPAGSIRMPNGVFIERADWIAAEAADELKDGTTYFVPEV